MDILMLHPQPVRRISSTTIFRISRQQVHPASMDIQVTQLPYINEMFMEILFPIFPRVALLLWVFLKQLEVAISTEI